MSSSPLRHRAFTLIELLIVIVIIGILAVALLPNITRGPGRARDAARKAALQQIATGLEFYAQDNGGYPLVAGKTCATEVFALKPLTGLNSIPVDPSGLGATGPAGLCTTGYTYIGLDTNSSGPAEGYILIAASESTSETATSGVYSDSWTIVKTDTFADNIVNATPCINDTACTSGDARYYVVGH